MSGNVDPAIYTLLENIVAQAKARGATDAVAGYFKNESIDVETREGKIESIKNPVSSGISIRVLFNQKSGGSSVNALDSGSIAKALDIAIENASIASDNPYGDLARPDQVPQSFADPQIYDAAEPTVAELAAKAMAAENAALAVDPRIQPGQKSFAHWERSTAARVASNGFRGGYQESVAAFGTIVVAVSGDKLETDDGQTVAHFWPDLKAPEEVGQEAAKKLLAKLDAQKPPVESISAPVIFSPDAARQIIGAFVGAIDGMAAARKLTFLHDKQGQQVFPADITITDNPHLPRGLGSHPFDREGIAPQKLILVENGVLKNFLLNLEAARQLGVETNGRAGGRSTSISNLFLQSASAVSPEDLIAGVENGFYVTEIQGHGAHIVEGEFSQGARGRWITGGKLAQAVSGATIAGKLADMFGSLRAANDVDISKPESQILVPTIRVDGMTIGG